MSFGGSTYDPAQDGSRLRAQLDAVKTFMADGVWRTLQEISDETGAPPASVSARLRDLRKKQFGGHTVERRRVPNGNGLHQYRLVLKPAGPSLKEKLAAAVAAKGPRRPNHDARCPCDECKPWRVYCECGDTFQTREGWEAQGLFEDLPNGGIMHHHLSPGQCQEA